LRNKYQQSDGASGQLELFKKKKREMSDAERVYALQCKLYQKASQDRSYKFYVLYDKLSLGYMLREAWRSVKANGGSPGIDGVSISDVEKQGVEDYLKVLEVELRERRYRPQAVKRVMIPKANGGERPLGIPTVRGTVYLNLLDRIVENPKSEFWKYGLEIVRYADDFVLMGKEKAFEILVEKHGD
jgi:RNA-directed DNA polymerase